MISPLRKLEQNCFIHTFWIDNLRGVNPRGDLLSKRTNKVYRPGDQIHIAVTQSFEDTATDFFRFCNDNHYNPSEVIRSCMEQWLERQRRIKEMMDGDLEMDPRSSMEKERRFLQRMKEEGLS